jgi:hypothetical protein
LLISFRAGPPPPHDRLVVGNYSEFTDGSGRSNYLVTETFARA